MNQKNESISVIGMTPEFELVALRNRVKDLERQILEERNRCLQLQLQLQNIIADRDANWKRIPSKEERERLRREKRDACTQRQLTHKKSDGNPIATPADGLTSFTEIDSFLTHLKDHGRLGVRNWAMFRVGICLGLRMSDLIRIRWCWLLNPDGTWRKRVPIVEHKTSKINNVLITEAVRETLNEYKEWLGDFQLESCVFSKTTGEPLSKKHASQILADANKVAQIDRHISSHTMRKTFANIVLACYDGSMEIESVDRVRSLFNHNSLQSTSHYLGIIQSKDDEARESVSDFILGKLDIDDLSIPKTKTNNELFEAIQSVQADLKKLTMNMEE